MSKVQLPAMKAPDSEIELPGRNLLMLSHAALFCAVRQVPIIWVGTLKANKFRDAKPAFFRQMEQVTEAGLGWSVRIETPLRKLTKPQVMATLPPHLWENSFSCIGPVGDRHCGQCQKCAERKRGFTRAHLVDPTIYA